MKRTLITPPLLAGILLFLLYALCGRGIPTLYAAADLTDWNAPAPSAGHAATTITAAQPDLAITQVTFNPPNPTGNTVGDITVVMRNVGAATATGFRYYLYVDPAEVPPTATSSATTRGFYGLPLEPGATITWTRTGHLFTSERPRVYAWVDPTWENNVLEADENNNLFPHPAAAIVTVTPVTAAVGTTVTLAITGEKTHFLPAVTSADLGAGLTVAAVEVRSSTQALVTVAIAEAASPGSRMVQLTTGAEQVRQNAAFTVTRPPQAMAITAIEPDQAAAGTPLTVTVTASNTHFVAGQTTLTLGNGITISAVNVISPTQLIATAGVAAAAAPGVRTVTVQTGTEVVTRAAGFRVIPAAATGAILYLDPTPAALYVSEMQTLTMMLTPGITPVNSVQIHGQVDPLYLRLVDVVTTGTPLLQTMTPITFEVATGKFTYRADKVGTPDTTPFPVLELVVQALRPTAADGTAVRFLRDDPATAVTGAAGSVLAEARDGQVLISERATLATIHGHVDLQGRPLRPHASWVTLLTIQLIPTDTQQAPVRHIVVTNEQGDFTVRNVPSGNYTIWVKGDHTLANRVEKIVLAAGSNRIYLGTLLEGDAETDTSRNHVTLRDFSLVSNAFGACVGDQHFVFNTDLTQDGCVTIDDAALVRANYNRQGDLRYDMTVGIPAPLAPAERHATLHFMDRSMARGPNAQAANNDSPITVNRVITTAVAARTVLPLWVDPQQGDPILGLTAHFAFDPNKVEIVDVYLSSSLPIELLGAIQIDNTAGRIRFSVQSKVGQPITQPSQFGYIQVKLKQPTPGTVIYPLLNARGQTAIVGANGSLLARADSVTLASPVAAGTGDNYPVFLPFVTR